MTRPVLMRMFANDLATPFLLLGTLIWGAISSSAEIVPAPNAPTDVWSVAGIPGGIPDRTTIYTTLSPGATAAQIQSAINSCPSGQVVKLNAGTYDISAISLQSPGNWVLRGAGMGQTILNMSGGSANFAMGSYPPWGGSYINTASVIAGGGQGSTNIAVSSGGGYAAGDLAVIDMENSGWINGYGAGGTGGQVSNNDSAGKLRDANRVQLHIVEVTAVNGNNLTFWPPLPYALDSARAPQISEMGVRGPRWSGIEDLTFNFSGTSSAGLSINAVYAFWLKNVEVKNWGTFGVWPRWSACFEMRGCYVHDPNSFNWGKGYALQLDPCSGSLIIDNIFYKNQDTILLQGGCAGNVVAYNCLYRSYNGYIGTGWLLQSMAVNHTPFPCYNLFEGNYAGKLQADYYYGPSGWSTILRNRIAGNDVDVNENRYAVSIDAQQRYYSVVGNQLGEKTAPASITLAKPNVTLNYTDPGPISWGYDPGSVNFGYPEPYIFRLGYPFSGNNSSGTGTAVHDPLVKTSTLRHGNWDAANNAVVWDPSIADRDIPNSLFLNSKPSWFGNLAWPPYGSSAPTDTVSDLAKIPAGYRLLYNTDPPSGPANQPPVVTAMATPTSGPSPLSVSFSSAGSIDPEGGTVNFSWNFGDGGTSTAANPSRSYSTTGVYTARLTVSDGATSVTSANLIITVTAPITNVPPVASASATNGSGVAPLTVAFSSAGSTDPNGTALTYAWTFGDGAASTVANPSHTYQSVGSYIAQLTVSDGTFPISASPINISVIDAAFGLVAAYGFQEGSGTAVPDLSGNGNIATINGADWTDQGKFGRALSFNGTSDTVVISGAPSLSVQSAMTQEAWVYPTASQASWATVLHRETDAYYLHASSPAGAMRPAGGAIFSGTESYVVGTGAIPLNTWTHLATTYDGTTLKMYVNGISVSSRAVSGLIQANSNPLRIGGNHPYGQYFQGLIDEVRVYNRALSAAEITNDMQTPVFSAGTPPAPPRGLRIVTP